MSRYIKAIMAFLGLLGTWGGTAGADGTYSQVELWGLCGVIVASYAVYQFPNKPPVGEHAQAGISEQDVYRPDPNSPEYGKQPW